MSETQLAEILGRLPSGLFVLTIRHEGEQTGLLTSWVQQAGFEPPMVTVALKRERYTTAWIDDGATFVLNVIGAEQKNLVRHFSRGFDEGEAAFSGLELAQTPSGAIVLAGALGYLECGRRSHADSGDHRVVLAEVVHGAVTGGGEPYVHVRKNGMRY